MVTLRDGIPNTALSGMGVEMFYGGEGSGVVGTCCVAFCGELHLGCVFFFFLAFLRVY